MFWLIVAYLLFVLIHVIINGYCKHIETYMDEWVYYGQAECLAKGMGFPRIYGGKYLSGRYLYSILISPAFLTTNRILQFRLATMINALMLGSGIFPIYLLAKDILEKEKIAVFTCLIYLFLPDMQLTAGFKTEALFLPLSLWAIFFSFQLLNSESHSKKKNIQYFLCFVLICVLLMLTKRAGILFALCFAVLFLVSRGVCKFRNGKEKETGRIGKKTLLSIVLIGLILVFFFVFFRFAFDGYFFKNFVAWIQKLTGTLQEKGGMLAYCYLYTWMAEILAIGVFPLIIPALYFKNLSKQSRFLYIYLLILLAAFNVGAALTSLSMNEKYGIINGAETRFFLYQRYVLFIWIPILIVFISVLKRNEKIGWKGSLISMTISVLTAVFFQGSLRGTAFECTLLYWSENWLFHRNLWVIALILLAGVGLLIWNRRRRLFLILFCGVMIFLQVWNNITMWNTIHGAYRFDYRNIEELERFVRENEDNTILITTIQSDTEVPNIEAKVADTFLVYPNTYRTSRSALLSEGSIDLKEEALIPGAFPVGNHDLDSVDYMVVTHDTLVNAEKCKKVESVHCLGFALFELEDKTIVPEIGTWENPMEEFSLPADDLYFYTRNFDDTGAMLFESTENCAYDNPEVILFGPYVTLSPGKYQITVVYDSDETDNEKEIIGIVYLSGSEINSEETQKELFEDEKDSTIEIELPDGTEGFEVQVVANTPGVRIKEIGFRCDPYTSDSLDAEMKR